MNKLHYLSFILALCFSLGANAEIALGPWSGTLSVQGFSLPMCFRIVKNDEGKLTCTLDVPAQGLKNHHTELKYFDNDSVAIDMPRLQATYRAKLVGNTLKGDFVQLGQRFELLLENKELATNRPQTPKPPFLYETREISFTNATDSVTLEGTLTYPLLYNMKKKGSVPLVVMVTGSGTQNRDEETLDHKPFLVIADYLAKNGIASLRYDDRGISPETRDKALSATTQNLYLDAKTAVDYARSLGEFGKVGILGHSEGGCIAFMASARGDIDFAVSLAGAAVRGDSIVIKQTRRSLELLGTPSDTLNMFTECFETIIKKMEAGDDFSNPKAVAEEVAKSKGFELSPTNLSILESVCQMRTPWLNYILCYDFGDDVSKAQCPVFALNGSKDVQVDAKQNLSAIKRLLPPNSKNKVKEFPQLNHLFQHCTTGAANEYYQIEETISPEVLKEIADWINGL